MANQEEVKALLVKLRNFVRELKAPFVGRDDEATVVALAIISGEHAVLIGEPGTAKSAIARRAADLLEARFFKYLLTRFTEPGELFGPLDVKALREGKYKRITRGKLPEAEIAFLDEIFNANSAVLNSLLSILQERVLYDGYTEVRVPLWSLIAASNRIPEDPELEALYDRLLYRHYVKPLQEDLWDQLLDAAWALEAGKYASPKPVMNMNDVKSINKLIFQVDFSRVKSQLLRLFTIFEEKGMHVTDRRKGKILKAIAAHALMEGRLVAEEMDLIVLKYTVPKDLDDFEKIEVILREEIRSKERILREIEEIRNNVKRVSIEVKRSMEFDPKLTDYYKWLNQAKSRLAKIASTSDDPEVRRALETLNDEIDSLIHEIMLKLNL